MLFSQVCREIRQQQCEMQTAQLPLNTKFTATRIADINYFIDEQAAQNSLLWYQSPVPAIAPSPPSQQPCSIVFTSVQFLQADELNWCNTLKTPPYFYFQWYKECCNNSMTVHIKIGGSRGLYSSLYPPKETPTVYVTSSCSSLNIHCCLLSQVGRTQR